MKKKYVIFAIATIAITALFVSVLTYGFVMKYLVDESADTKVTEITDIENEAPETYGVGEFSSENYLTNISYCERSLLEDFGNSNLNATITRLPADYPANYVPAVVDYYYFEGVGEEIEPKHCQIDIYNEVESILANDDIPIGSLVDVHVKHKSVYIAYMSYSLDSPETGAFSVLLLFDMATGEYEELVKYSEGDWASIDEISYIGTDIYYDVSVTGPAPCAGECGAALEANYEKYVGVWRYDTITGQSERVYKPEAMAN